VDYDTNALRKKVNEVQKEISAKKKVSIDLIVIYVTEDGLDQAKQSADDLVATKKEIDAQVEEKKKEAREFEIKMRQKASTVGNIVGKNVPVSLTEVNRPFC
jgi:seryl-tRNA synthetase